MTSTDQAEDGRDNCPRSQEFSVPGSSVNQESLESIHTSRVIRSNLREARFGTTPEALDSLFAHCTADSAETLLVAIVGAVERWLFS